MGADRGLATLGASLVFTQVRGRVFFGSSLHSPLRTITRLMGSRNGQVAYGRILCRLVRCLLYPLALRRCEKGKPAVRRGRKA
jgi:hypothetical protein